MSAYSLAELARLSREKSFEEFRKMVGHALFMYLYFYQPGPGQEHFRLIGSRGALRPSRYVTWAKFTRPVRELWAYAFDRFVYWHVQYILKLGGYLNDKDKNDA